MAKKKNIPLEDIIELHNQGLYDKEIAEILGCTRENIVKRLNKAGIKNRKSKIKDYYREIKRGEKRGCCF